MISPRSIRTFLIGAPRPAIIRLTAGGQTQDMAYRRGQSWTRLAESIHAVSPELIECLDDEQNIIRAIRPENSPELSESAPEPPRVLTDDPETARLTHFANLLHRAYEHSTVVAFSKLIELVERIDARSDAIEARLERTEGAYRRAIQSQVDDAFERADELLEQGEQGDQLQRVIGAFAQGVAQRQARRRTNGKGGDS